MNRLPILLASALAVLTSVASAEPLKVALFADRGCLGNGVAFWAELLHDSPDVDLKIVDGADIRGGALDDRELLVMPGGHGKPQYEALGDEGAERIRAFVRDGGRYFGTCCGFSMALNENRKDMKRLKMLPLKRVIAPNRGGVTATVKFNRRGADYFRAEPGTTLEQVKDVYREYYGEDGLVRFVDDPAAAEGGFLSSAALSGRDDMEVSVYGNDERIVLVSRFDNLGKGASGAAIQNMNLVLGVAEETGLKVEG